MIVGIIWLVCILMPFINSRAAQLQKAREKKAEKKYSEGEELEEKCKRPSIWTDEGFAAFDEKWQQFAVEYPQIADQGLKYFMTFKICHCVCEGCVAFQGQPGGFINKKLKQSKVADIRAQLIEHDVAVEGKSKKALEAEVDNLVTINAMLLPLGFKASRQGAPSAAETSSPEQEVNATLGETLHPNEAQKSTVNFHPSEVSLLSSSLVARVTPNEKRESRDAREDRGDPICISLYCRKPHHGTRTSHC